MKLRLFFSWQSETDVKYNKKFWAECITEAIAKVHNELGEVNIEYQEGVSGEPGSPDITKINEERIKNCHIYVADMTFVGLAPDRKKGFFGFRRKRNGNEKKRVIMNANVLHEHGIACGRRNFDSQIIKVLNTINGSPNDADKEMPVDLRQRRNPIEYKLSSCPQFERKNVKRELVKDLTKAIKGCVKSAQYMLDKDIYPFITHKKQIELSDFIGDFYWDGYEPYKKEITENTDNLRILGLYGLGKTRLVLESFRGQEDNWKYAYVDCQDVDEKEIKNKLPFIFENYPELILIFDNCDKILHDKITDYKTAKRAINPIITICNDYGEADNSVSKPLRLGKKFDKVVDEIFDGYKDYVKNYDLKKLKEFADGIPKIALVLGEGLKHGEPLGQINDDALMGKFLGVDKNSRERKILRSLSLFDFIGFAKELHGETAFVATNKDITSIDGSNQVLEHEFDEIILRYKKKGIIECKGRMIGIRPIPIALRLVAEWIEECTTERLQAVVHSIQGSVYSVTLSRALLTQFQNMAFDEKAKMMVAEFMNVQSPFVNAEVINTELGSRLFRSFAEVNPVAVASGLYYALGTQSTSELKKLAEGRRNIVWTLDKLCYDSRCFNKAAKMMMLLGIAENEEYGNNATSQFIGLFPVMLPATETPLNDRLDFLRQMMATEEYKEIVLKAISRALRTGDFFLMGGAERQGTKNLSYYKPKTYEEIREYLSGCIELVKNEIGQHSAFEGQCLGILEDNFGILCRCGLCDLILPLIEDVSERKNGNWDKMLDTLYLVKNNPNIVLTKEQHGRVDRVITKLMKTDIVSRYCYINKEGRWNFNTMALDAVNERIENLYSDLAKEIASKKLYDKEILHKILTSENLLTYSFGKVLAESLNSEEQLIVTKNFIDAIPDFQYNGYAVLVDFMKTIDTTVFDFAFSELLKKEKYDIAFSCTAARGLMPDNPKFDCLYSLVKCGKVPVDIFLQYWSFLTIGEHSDSDIAKLFSKISKLPGSFQTVLHMAMMTTFGDNYSRMPETFEVITNVVLKDAASEDLLEPSEQYWHIINFLLKRKHNPELACTLNKKVIKFLDSDSTHYSSYGLDDFYQLLVRDYFSEVWKDISDTLVNDEFSGYRLHNILGSKTGSYNEAGILFTEDHTESFMAWCERYPEKAPAILIEMVPLDGNGKFPDLVIKILEKYADKPYVLNSLEAHLGTFAITGSVLPLLYSQKRAVEALLNNKNAIVRQWAAKMTASYEKKIEDAQNFEEEHYTSWS
ncbi:MAG: hypothetical protein LUC91_08615 [Prevotella sp.]|nr:hypothetical protein [Prevotella sp.]